MIRNYLVCDADFPAECPQATGAAENLPPGKELAEFLQVILRNHAVKMTDVWNEEDYSWCFNCEWRRVTICVQVGWADARWLIVFIIVSFLPGFLRSRKYGDSLQSICKHIDELLKSDDRFRNLRWFTADEFDASPE